MQRTHAALFSSIAVAFSSLCVSCSHQLSVVNREDYALKLTEGKRRDIAVVPFQGDQESSAWADQVVEALRRHPSVGMVRTNWKGKSAEPGFSPDCVVGIHPQAEYSGSGWNFLLAFPGFLFFLPAAHGFVYHGDVTTDVDLYENGAAEPSRTVSVPATFNMRHCDFERAFFAETGWWVPGWGASSALAAPFMIIYDSDATEPLQKEVGRVYGDWVAEHLIRTLNGTPDEAVAVVTTHRSK